MFVPFITPRDSRRSLSRRKGGGGSSSSGKSSSTSGKSSSSSSGKTSSSSLGETSSSSSGETSSSSSGKSSSSSSGKSSSSSSSKTTTIQNSPFKSSKSTQGSRGGGIAQTIPAGQLFAGRIAGGGTRSQIFGSRTYGSGYPGIVGRGTAGRGFPFFFWPIVWPLGAGGGAATYLSNEVEYGKPDNSSRPGGPMATATFPSKSGTSNFQIVADNATVVSLITSLSTNCSTYLGPSVATQPTPFNASDPATPKPEQVIQYYRASTIALTLDGYNNTATMASEGTPDTALPANVDISLMNCLNQTMGVNAPLIDGAIPRWTTTHIELLGLIWVVRCLFSIV